MKKTAIFTILISFLIKIQAQTIVIAADKMNVFYIGVDNPVAVAVEGVLNEKLKISTDNGVIIKNEKNDFIVRPERTGIGNIIIEWDGQKVLKPFRVKDIPDPVVRCCCLDRDSILFFNGLVADLQNFDFDARCQVVNYECVYIPSNGDAQQIKVNGNISPELTKVLANFKKGDK